MGHQSAQFLTAIRAEPQSSGSSNRERLMRSQRRTAKVRFSVMPRYFFNTRIGNELIADSEGEELRNPDRAWEVARAMIREVLRTEGRHASLLNASIEVTDEDGEIVLEFPFTEAVIEMSGRRATKH
jgi:hypothetical protein